MKSVIYRSAVLILVMSGLFLTSSFGQISAEDLSLKVGKAEEANLQMPCSVLV